MDPSVPSWTTLWSLGKQLAHPIHWRVSGSDNNQTLQGLMRVPTSAGPEGPESQRTHSALRKHSAKLPGLAHIAEVIPIVLAHCIK